jgi:hypothetical protein
MISTILEETDILKTRLVQMVKWKLSLLETKKDTLSNGKIIVRTFPGQIAQVPDENETYLRQNFDKSNINYRDGDKQSSKYYDFGSSESDKLKADRCIIRLNITLQRIV